MNIDIFKLFDQVEKNYNSDTNYVITMMKLLCYYFTFVLLQCNIVIGSNEKR